MHSFNWDMHTETSFNKVYKPGVSRYVLTFPRKHAEGQRKLAYSLFPACTGEIVSLQIRAGAYAFQNRHNLSESGPSKVPMVWEQVSIYCFDKNTIANDGVGFEFVSIRHDFTLLKVSHILSDAQTNQLNVTCLPQRPLLLRRLASLPLEM